MKLAITFHFAIICSAAATARYAQNQDLEERQLIGDVVGPVVSPITNGLLLTLHNAVVAGDAGKVLDVLHRLKPAGRPKTVEEASSILRAIATSSPPSLVEYIAQLLVNGLFFGSIDDLFSYANGLFSEDSRSNHSNPDPPTPVYPKVDDCDAPYSSSESDLRSAIFIPSGFSYGIKPPVVLFPGTASTGYASFIGSFIPLLSGSEWADPVWVNVPDMLVEDAQVNAEYAAYALNYIASLTRRNVSMIAWSQGNINTQWAFKYWRSTRNITNNHVAISADYKGTVAANILNPSGLVNVPSVVQQQSGSDFIRTLRANGGDSAYVPTTSVYSGFLDMIVQPQSGSGASALLLDERGVGVTNAEVQAICRGLPGGSLYTHESMLLNPLLLALARDALTNDGPGKVSRLNLKEVCSTHLSPGLGLSELLITESTLIIAGIKLLSHAPKVSKEPAIQKYSTIALERCS
ncbi:hypothetical protein CDD83_2298 [Cordyceps sp. RAO-2017]|nr:hypothetical protein CDD83_2298 [Cordyceps sp. RAO-2017]